MKRLFTLLLALLGFLRGCAYDSFGGVPSIPVEREPSTSYTIDLSKTRAPNVLSVTVDNAVEPYLYNMLDVHVLHTDVSGLFGCPVEVTADELESAVLTFEYDPDNMKGVPAKNLIGLYYNEEEYNYEEMLGELDESANTLTFEISREGSYMLVDAYEWFLAWGADLPQYAHPLELHFDGGEYPSYYPALTAVVPTDTTLSFSADLEFTIYDEGENELYPEGLFSKDYFQSKNGSGLQVNAETIRGENAWAYALESVDRIKSNPEIDGTHFWETLDELVNERERIILLFQSSTIKAETRRYVTVYYYVSESEYVCMNVSIPASESELHEQEMLDFAMNIEFHESNDPWYNHKQLFS